MLLSKRSCWRSSLCLKDVIFTRMDAWFVCKRTTSQPLLGLAESDLDCVSLRMRRMLERLFLYDVTWEYVWGASIQSQIFSPGWPRGHRQLLLRMLRRKC